MPTVFDVGQYFLCRSCTGGSYAITHLKLQKLVYYAQAWSLAVRGKPIFDNPIEAWTHGPVSPDLYRNYRNYGYNTIPPENQYPQLSNSEIEVLDGVWDLYGSHDGKYLESLTHQEDPWQNAWNRGKNTIISLDEMREYYSNWI